MGRGLELWVNQSKGYRHSLGQGTVQYTRVGVVEMLKVARFGMYVESRTNRIHKLIR